MNNVLVRLGLLAGVCGIIGATLWANDNQHIESVCDKVGIFAANVAEDRDKGVLFDEVMFGIVGTDTTSHYLAGVAYTIYFSEVVPKDAYTYWFNECSRESGV